MALDPSIALGVKPVEIQNPLNAFAQMSQIQNYQRQNELANRAIEQEDALNRAYAASRRVSRRRPHPRCAQSSRRSRAPTAGRSSSRATGLSLT